MKLSTKFIFAILALLALSTNATEKSKVCATCHGVGGLSSDPAVPNLAGQKKAYLAAQLSAFKNKNRQNPLMNAIAANLSDEEIETLATFFSEQSTANLDNDVTNSIGSALANNKLDFPNNFPDAYTQYATKNRADNKQVRYLYLSNDAIASFKQTGALDNDASVVMAVYKAKLNDQGEPIAGDDGFYQKDSLAAYAIMKKETDWGINFPFELANGDWKYGFYKADKTFNTDSNMAKCMACHQPLADQEYMFMFDDLKNTFAAR